MADRDNIDVRKKVAAQRGTQDEVEILAMILEDNPILKRRVLDAIRFAKAGSAFGIQASAQSEKPAATKVKKPA